MKAMDVALFYIDLFSKDNKYSIDHLKLQKILYYAQGWYLAKYNKPLFDDSIEAWKLGPVVSSVYNAYKFMGGNPFVVDKNEEYFDEKSITIEELELLIDVYNEYSKYSGIELKDMTHQKDSPWSMIYEENKNKEIPNDLIKKYFLKQDAIPSISDIDFSRLKRIGKIDQDGHLLLPASERD